MPEIKLTKLPASLPSDLERKVSATEWIQIRTGVKACELKPGARNVSWSEWLIRGIVLFATCAGTLLGQVLGYLVFYDNLRVLRVLFNPAILFIFAVIIAAAVSVFVIEHTCDAFYGAVPTMTTSSEYAANALAFFSSANIAPLLKRAGAKLKIRDGGKPVLKF
jgi:hypothetical protein